MSSQIPLKKKNPEALYLRARVTFPLQTKQNNPVFHLGPLEAHIFIEIILVFFCRTFPQICIILQFRDHNQDGRY